MTDEEQQQNETVSTTTRSIWSNLYKLLSVQEVISPMPMQDLPLQQLKMK